MNHASRDLLLEESPFRLYMRYLGPSLCGCFFTSFYVLTDTMMIGRGIGPVGLTALNIMLPVYSFFMCFGFMTGIGGAVCIAVARGEKNDEEADRIYTTSMVFLLLLALLMTILCNLFLGQFVDLLGADSSNRRYAMEYGRIMMLSAVSYFLTPVLQNYVKNDNDPNLVMVAAIVGNLLNVVLDYVFIFIFKWGMTGAILATVLGFTVNWMICATHLLKKENRLKFRPELIDPRCLIRVFSNGAASFLTEFAVGLIVFVFNRQVLSWLGSAGLVIFSVINNYIIIVTAMINSAGYAAQPLLSYNFGAGMTARVRELRRIGLAAALLIAVLLYLLALIRPVLILSLFLEDSSAYRSAGSYAIRVYFSGAVFEAVSLYCGSYFQSVMQPARAFILGILRGFLLPVLLILLLPLLFGGTSIWYAVPAAEFITALAAVLMLKRSASVSS